MDQMKEAVGLASPTCVFCKGIGLRRSPVKEELRLCGCVYRAVFRACFVHWSHCLNLEKPTIRSREYAADFQLACRRGLNLEEFEVFEQHFANGRDWAFCTEKLGIDKGTFFHRVYVIQEKLGRVFKEMKPYALFPIPSKKNCTSEETRGSIDS